MAAILQAPSWILVPISNEPNPLRLAIVFAVGCTDRIPLITTAACSFPECVAIDVEFTFKILKPASSETGAPIGFGGTGLEILSLAQYWSLGLPSIPEKLAEKPSTVLFYAGSTSVRTLAIQLLKL